MELLIYIIDTNKKTKEKYYKMFNFDRLKLSESDLKIIREKYPDGGREAVGHIVYGMNWNSSDGISDYAVYKTALRINLLSRGLSEMTEYVHYQASKLKLHDDVDDKEVADILRDDCEDMKMTKHQYDWMYRVLEKYQDERR